MSRPVLVVDAYNVIHDWWRPQDKVALGMCRERLLNELASYASTEDVRTIVVFDAGLVPGKAVRDEQAGLEVVFSAADETADTVIERLCFELSASAPAITVATSDRVQAQVVFGKGVFRMSAPHLKATIERARQEAKRLMKAKRRQDKSHRLEHTLDASTWARLEQWRRGG